MNLHGICAALVAGSLLFGCGESAQKSKNTEQSPTSGSYVGKLQNSDAFVAIVMLESGETLAYVCDSKTISQWFRGTAVSGTLDLVAEGAWLKAIVSTNEISGAIQLADGFSSVFDAEPTDETTGLYRATVSTGGISYVGGWILLKGGEQRGAVTALPSGPVTSPTVLASTTRTSSSQDSLQTQIAQVGQQASDLKTQQAKLSTIENKIATLAPAIQNAVNATATPARLSPAPRLTAGTPIAVATAVSFTPIKVTTRNGSPGLR